MKPELLFLPDVRKTNIGSIVQCGNISYFEDVVSMTREELTIIRKCQWLSSLQSSH